MILALLHVVKISGETGGCRKVLPELEKLSKETGKERLKRVERCYCES